MPLADAAHGGPSRQNLVVMEPVLCQPREAPAASPTRPRGDVHDGNARSSVGTVVVLSADDALHRFRAVPDRVVPDPALVDGLRRQLIAGIGR